MGLCNLCFSWRTQPSRSPVSVKGHLISAKAFLQHQQKQSSLLKALVLCYNAFFETSYFRCGCWDVRERFWEV